MDWTNGFDPTISRDLEDGLHQCYVTEEVFHETQLIYDHEERRWFHKSKIYEYNELLSIEYQWTKKETNDNYINLLNQ